MPFVPKALNGCRRQVFWLITLSIGLPVFKMKTVALQIGSSLIRVVIYSYGDSSGIKPDSHLIFPFDRTEPITARR